MKIITETIRAEREFAGVVATLKRTYGEQKPLPLLINGLSGGATLAFLAECAREAANEGIPFLLLVADDATGEKCAAALRAAGVSALAYPTRDLLFHNITASHGTERERLFVLHSILAQEVDAVVATPMAALGYTMPRARLASRSVTLKKGDVYDPTALCRLLDDLGYAHVEQVESAGQYARRGGILDLYAGEDGGAVRMEFFGDEIDGMRFFDPISQRQTAECPMLSLMPMREVLPDAAARDRVRKAILTLQKKVGEEGAATLAAELAAIDGGLEWRFADKYLPLIYEEKENLISYLTAKRRAIVALHGTAGVKESFIGARDLLDASLLALLEAGVLPAGSAYHAGEGGLSRLTEENASLHVNSFAGGVSGLRAAGLFGFRCRTGVSYADKPDLLDEDLATLVAGGYRTLIVAETAAEEAAVGERLRAGGYVPHPLPPDGSILSCDMPEKTVFTTHGVGVKGFELLNPRIAVLSLLPDGDHPRRTKRPLRGRHAAGKKLLSYAELREGDYVVHAVHGIGRFGSMTQMTVDGVARDYITIHYAGSDKLFLPADRLEMISKYIGAAAEDGRVKLSRLGGAEWQRTASRAKASARELAKELISLYAARMRRPGHAFPPDDDMQRAFEEAFPFEDTDGQIEACEDIRRDMQRPVPMDRLLCGDVGYGKTEVALRAAFRAVAGGKQVAFLVPTTILAMQHFETASARLRGFPVTVEMLTRFRTPKQQEAILRRLRRGEIDILIGTHKLLGRAVTFRDLGLLIVDEEQRFGVSQKEKLKAMAGDVDVLTLTATPIPRTLNMAMSGIRDMSLLDEAPADRFPVQTYVLEHDELVISEAIRRELRRGGQVIYLYNRVDTIAAVAARLGREIPEARIVVAHGQMGKEDLEDIWQSLVRGEIDVIVCTTIVETGVDLPNANTLIIEDADRLGLSQLHQLRGRVGRSRRHAYAYFTYRAGKALSEIAEKRLAAIREYAAFGAGFKIALRDLEIRGAGSLLGAEQHGHIEAVGYDLFIRLLNEAVLEEQGKSEAPKTETVVDIRKDAHIPEGYISLSAARMEMYKKISLIEEESDRLDLLEELCDRFGRPPRPVLRLLSVALARAIASRCGITRIEGDADTLRLVLERPNLEAWSVLFSERNDLRFSRTPPPSVSCRLSGRDAADVACEILSRYAAVLAEGEEKGDKT